MKSGQNGYLISCHASSWRKRIIGEVSWAALKFTFSYYSVQCKLMHSFTMLSRSKFAYFPNFLSQGILFVLSTLWGSRKLSKFAKTACSDETITLDNYMTKVHLEKWKIWIIRKIFQSQTNIFSSIIDFNCRVFFLFEIQVLKKLITKAKF